MKRCVPDRSFSIKAVTVLVGFVLTCALLTSTAYSAGEKVAGAMPIKATGHVKSVSVKDRLLNIDGEIYNLSDNLVIKNKKGRVMEGFVLEYFITVDLIEYIRIDKTINEIKIMRHTS
jgi:hypothetical protein